MKSFICITFIAIFAFSKCFAQMDSSYILSSYIPKELKGELLYVEKYSDLSSAEAIDISNALINKKRDECLESIYAYNLVFRRKINAEIESVFDEYKLDNIRIASTRDINENLDNNIRFVLKAEFSSEALVTGVDYSPKYYIYDQIKGVGYASFWSLDATLETLESFNWYANNRIVDGTAQADVDNYVNRNVPNEPRSRRRLSGQAKGTIVGVLGFAALFVINAIIELN